MKTELFHLLNSLKLENDEDKTANIDTFKKYFKEFFRKYPANDYINASNMAHKEIITSLLLIEKPYNSIRIIELVDKYEELFESSSNWKLFATLIEYFNNFEFKELIDYINNAKLTNIIKASIKMSAFCSKYNIDQLYVKNLVAYFENNPEAKEDFRPILTALSATVFNKAVKFSAITEAFRDFLKDFEIKKKNICKMMQQMVREKDPFLNEFSDYFNLLYKEYFRVVKQLDIEVKAINKRNKKIEELKSKLDVVGEIKDIDGILNLCPTDEAKNLTVDYVMAHNLEYYNTLSIELDNLKKNSDENLKSLFAKYGYDYSCYDSNKRILIKQKAYENIEDIFKRLQILRIYNPTLDISCVDILNISRIEDMIVKGMLNSDFVINHINLLYSKNPDLELICHNLTLLFSNSINMMNYSNSQEILFSQVIENNLSILKSYGLIITKTTSNINFLSDANLADKIDFIITIGLFDELNSLDILNYSMINLQKLKLSILLNIPPQYLENYNSEFNYKLSDEIIPTDFLDKLNNLSTNEVFLPASLLNYQKSQYILFINGVFVSSKKFLKNLSKFEQIEEETIFYSLIYDSYYSLEEIEHLKEAIMPNRDFYLLVRR